MQLQKQRSGLILLLALSVLALSCFPCQTSSQVIPTPARTVPVSTEAAEDLVAILGGDLVLDAEGCFILIVTEEELTSYVALNMRESIIAPQILLTDGKIHLYGTIVSPLEAPVTAIASAEASEGQVQITVETVALGGFPIPETFIAAFARQIDDFITFAQRQESMEINEIEITEGELIIRGCAV
ncbi:MAG: hypothetical protein CEE40_07135 [Chloroflexi bacterium B3_Chlor]|nr:MAG: hypothetical protein CEE40_07135 [Chloroflexi bacterium B3_Chlor]